MISDYEDDDHYCIKCHVTIAGLENYIQHRKANCTKTIVVVPKSPLPSQLLAPDDSFGLKADDFFSSLELQSSNKKQAMPSTSGKTISGILTRSKTSAVIHASTSTSGGSNSTTAATTQQLREVDVQQSKSGKHAWIGGHQLKELGTGDNQTKLIKAVDNLSRTACLKKYEPPTDAPIVVSGYNDASDEESDEYDYDDDEEDDEEVPRNYTGGKWMPEWNYSKAAGQNHTKGQWKSGSPHETNVPPPSYTRGKWKPSNLKESDQQDEPKIKKRTIEEIPPFRKSNGSVQYWCNPCNRLLSSKIVYERHLRSELHSKRTLLEAEFDDTTTTTSSKTTTASASTSATHLNTNRDKEAKRTIRKPVEYWSHTGATNENNKDPMKNTADASAGAVAADAAAESATSVTTSNASVTKTAAPAATVTAPTPITMTMAASATKKRFRRKIYAKCEVCLARVTSQMMGKHLISHYHCRKGDITRPEARQMVLDNIQAVVLQSPYQCAACKFYCNTHDYFLRHWRSYEHIEQVLENGGILTCTFCRFSCVSEQYEVMYSHLNSEEHEEVISVINRSVPIVIKNTEPIECGTCQESFTLNIQLRQHCLLTNHPLSGTATDEYQKKKYCRICQKNFFSSVALQRHLKVHNAKMFFCSRCDVEFSTAEEIAKHRITSLHKQKLPALKTCEYCASSETFDNLHQFKIHMQSNHPELTNVCPHCARKFTFAKELSVHIRSKSCMITPKLEFDDKPHKCDRCMFGCATLSELLFHQALHTKPVRNEVSKQMYYKCSLCDKFFPKSSLRYHIQNHTNEKTYKCSKCDARFARKNNWLYHQKKHEHKDYIRKPSSRTGKEMNFLCATCGAKFSNNATLKKHMLIHNGKQFKCDHPGCIHMARTPADLSAHRSTHSTEMSFRCERCDYRGKSKQQLKRHATIHEYVKKYQCSRCSFTCRLAFHLRRHERIHTGSKPFACPHCEYRCNNLENLRKHVLSTNKHPDKCIYECKFCETETQFTGNFAKDFKAHLLAEHGDVFRSVREAASYIAGIYDSIEDVSSAAQTATTSTSPVAVEPTAAPLLKTNKINPTMLDAVVKNEAPSPTLIPTPETTFENKGHHQEELFPMCIIAKDEVVYLDKESWCMVGNFDVEESGTLVSFNEEADAEPLFQEHFS